MALDDKKYERIFSKTGSDADKISTDAFNEIKEDFDQNRYLEDIGQFSTLGPVLYQLQLMQDELDSLRTQISANKDKTTFPGIGTSGSTCLAGNTTTISTSQASAITANTAKTGITKAQSKEITANTAKTGITDNQSDAITANTAKISFPACATNVEDSTATITGFTHTYSPKTKSNTLKISLQLVSGKGLKANYSTTLTLLQELG